MTQRGKGGGGKHEALQVDFTQARFMTRCNVLVLNRMAQTSEVCVKKKKVWWRAGAGWRRLTVLFEVRTRGGRGNERGRCWRREEVSQLSWLAC